MSKGISLVGLDVHARQTHAAGLDPQTGEVAVSKLVMAPNDVASFLESVGPDVLAVYEAGATGFGLARAAAARGIDVRVAAPGSIPRGPGDRVKTDRRDSDSRPGRLCCLLRGAGDPSRLSPPLRWSAVVTKGCCPQAGEAPG